MHPTLTDEQLDALSSGEFYFYMLTQDHIEWARQANRMAKLGLSQDAEDTLSGWFANAMAAVTDRKDMPYIRARLDAENREDGA